MSPEQYIKRAILQIELKNDPRLDELKSPVAVDNLWDTLWENDQLHDIKYGFRSGKVETEIETEYSRHYESQSVAAQMDDGTWVGWTYWYGGGKHGEPEAIDWMEDAYFLDCEEEEKMVTVRTFKKK